MGGGSVRQRESAVSGMLSLEAVGGCGLDLKRWVIVVTSGLSQPHGHVWLGEHRVF